MIINTQPAVTRRRFRFSLRMLLVVVTALCVWLGFTVNAARRQKEAVEAITKAGGQVSYDYQMVPVKAGKTDNFSIDADASSTYPAWLRHLFSEDHFRSAVNVTFLGGTIPEEDLARLADLPDLRSIYLCQLTVSPTGQVVARHLQDSDLAVFGRLRELRGLTLLSTDINGAGLEFLASLKHLRRLHLTNLPIDDAGMKLIGKLTALETAYVEPVRRNGKRGRPSKLKTLLPEVYSRMLALIRAGAFACDAASLLGIAPETFCRWMARGALERRGIYRQFRQDVEQAQALARSDAEIRVYRENPLAWLRLGPGRTRPGLPGWTDLPRGDRNEPEFVLEPLATKQPIVECSRNPLADAFKLAEEVGLISITPAGRAMMKIGTSDEWADYDDNGGVTLE